MPKASMKMGRKKTVTASSNAGNMGVAATRREKVETKEAAIVDAAYALFATKGFAKSTLSDIAKAAGVAEGTVYLYFSNKEALAGGVIGKFYDELTERAREGVSRLQTTQEKLRFLADHHLENVIKDRLILDLLTVVDRDKETSAGGAVYTLNKRYVAIFDGVVRDGMWRGDIADVFTPWVVRDIFYGGLDYAVKTILITDRRGEAEKFTEELVRMITSSLPEKLEESATKADKRQELLTDRMEKAVQRIEEALGAGRSAKSGPGDKIDESQT